MNSPTSQSEFAGALDREHWDVPIRVRLLPYVDFSRWLDGELEKLVMRWADRAAPARNSRGAGKGIERTGPMPEKTAVIYAAANMQEAHLLKDALTEAGIRATVINNLLQGGYGADTWGLPTLARVAVPEEDALRAREMALEFDRHVANMGRKGSLAEQQSPDQSGPEEKPREPAPWPTCPRCGRRRTTRCPACGTVGSDFPAADPDFSGPLGLEGAGASPACSCGPRGCTPAGPVDPDEPVIVAEESPLAPPRTMLLCPTCDEPFVPEYPRRCEWCGQQFQSGFEVQPAGQPDAYEPGFDVRLAVVLMAILVLLEAVGVWLIYVFR